MHYGVFLGGGYSLYYALRSIFGGRILFILCITQYFREVDTIFTMQYAVFSGDEYYLYYALRSIFRGADIIYTMHYVVFLGSGHYLYYALRSIFGGRILFILCTT